MPSAGSIEVDQVQTAHAGIGKMLGYGYGVGIIGGLAGKVAGAEPDTLAIYQVDSRNYLHGKRIFNEN
jgi:hypothetical protein